MIAADFYRTHQQPAIRRAFMRGRNAARAGRLLDDNPYRTVRGSKRARSRSWTETYTLAWAAGWHSLRRSTS